MIRKVIKKNGEETISDLNGKGKDLLSNVVKNQGAIAGQAAKLIEDISSRYQDVLTDGEVIQSNKNVSFNLRDLKTQEQIKNLLKDLKNQDNSMFELNKVKEDLVFKFEDADGIKENIEEAVTDKKSTSILDAINSILKNKESTISDVSAAIKTSDEVAKDFTFGEDGNLNPKDIKNISRLKNLWDNTKKNSEKILNEIVGVAEDIERKTVIGGTGVAMCGTGPMMLTTDFVSNKTDVSVSSDFFKAAQPQKIMGVTGVSLETVKDLYPYKTGDIKPSDPDLKKIRVDSSIIESSALQEEEAIKSLFGEEPLIKDYVATKKQQLEDFAKQIKNHNSKEPPLREELEKEFMAKAYNSEVLSKLYPKKDNSKPFGKQIHTAEEIKELEKAFPQGINGEQVINIDDKNKISLSHNESESLDVFTESLKEMVRKVMTRRLKMQDIILSEDELEFLEKKSDNFFYKELVAIVKKKKQNKKGK